MNHKTSRGALLGLLSLVLIFGSTACYKHIEPGHAGIKLDRDDRWPHEDEIRTHTGRTWYNPFGTTIYQIPYFTQHVRWPVGSENHKITFNSSEGVIVEAGVGFGWAVKQSRIPYVFVALRADGDGINAEYMYAQISGAIAGCAQSKSLGLIYGAGRTEIATCAFKHVSNLDFIQDNFDLEYLTFIGAFQVHDALQQSIYDKMDAEMSLVVADRRQRVEILKAESGAAGDRIRAEGKRDALFLEAEGQERLGQSITPKLLAYQEQQEKACAK